MAKKNLRTMMEEDFFERRLNTMWEIKSKERDINSLPLPNCIVDRLRREIDSLRADMKAIEEECMRRYGYIPQIDVDW